MRDIAGSYLVLAEAWRQLGEREAAVESLEKVRDWALAAGSVFSIIFARLVGARLLRDQGDIGGALAEAEDGLRMADTCGFGLLAIDLRVLVAELCLETEPQELDRALHKATEALDRAEHPECDYFWGRLGAHGTIARIYEAQGDRTEARDHQRQAEAHRARVHIPPDLLAPLMEGVPLPEDSD